MTTDRFSGHVTGLDSPARSAFAITPGTEMTYAARALYIGTGGDLAVTTSAGDTVTFVAIPDGSILPVMVSAVASSGTTASNIIGLY